ncbi:carboxymuconolactone decarboxylase family protein [Streptomyces sp. NPDC050743]|uniref:carboxymuconolactone decarboxylase family protein n=1 Tax=Streptomyces sp. NPDC050743 TaxID=3365634 RepID=UPI0037B1C29E
MTDSQRVNIGEQHPAAYKTLIALSSEVGESAAAAGLDPLLVELLRIRTSQINGCAFCLRMHTGDALKKGENRPDRRASGGRSEGRCCGLGIRSGGLPQYLQWF